NDASLRFYVGARRPSRSTLLPYTTLFRSPVVGARRSSRPHRLEHRRAPCDQSRREGGVMEIKLLNEQGQSSATVNAPFPAALIRSEEHTSELQSRENLVCRLLLEKKKRTI